MDRDVDACALLQGIEGGLQLLDRFVTAVKGAAEDTHNANGVAITEGARFLDTQLQTLRRDRHHFGLHIEVGAELVPADLGVTTHHQVGTVVGEAGGLAALAPMPAHHQAAQHAGLTGTRGGGAHRLIRVGSMPEIGDDLEAALLNLRSLGIFVLIDHIFFGALLHQLPRLWLHPSSNKRGQI